VRACSARSREVIRYPEMTKKIRTPRLPESIRQSWPSHGAEPLDERCQATTIAIDSARMPSRLGMRWDRCETGAGWGRAGSAMPGGTEGAVSRSDHTDEGIRDVAGIFIALHECWFSCALQNGSASDHWLAASAAPVEESAARRRS
jgi:hypothetical protein